ncbi:hypothetical protein [Pandoraea apista]|uniref:hypothetical protein n=1 Tax=Pandoraea apista TaxID=93218 RepID=UPI000B8C1085|nr:hypothetical protein [Pandoraea apista]OXS88547.1 hypothetical protein B7H01_22660 [Pandoraea apista]
MKKSDIIVDKHRLQRPASLCWSNSLPVGSATVAVRQCIADLIRELQADGHWTGITLRPADRGADLA